MRKYSKEFKEEALKLSDEIGRQTYCQFLLVKIKEILTEHPDNDNYGIERIHKALIQNSSQNNKNNHRFLDNSR
ncbi:MAG: hypothetical protein KBA98_10310 [Syntrophorhabdaceae bacterium]|jgi:hypothetical protein|nr:hypothetical protein [Syntrophorhabdaceae bacterium]